MTTSPPFVKPLPNRLSYMTLLLLAGLADAAATEQIMRENNAPSCASCHTQGQYSKSEGKAGLKAFLDARAKAETAYRLKHRPTISPIAMTWDINAGQSLSIPLSVSDPEQDTFHITGTVPSGSILTKETTAANGLPTVFFKWTPTAAQANKSYALKFVAKETASAKKLASAAVTATVRVWPADGKEPAYISQLLVASSRWAAEKLTLKGSMTPNKMLTASEKSQLLARTDFTATLSQGSTGLGALIAHVPIKFMANGNWTLPDIPLAAPFACQITIVVANVKATRAIAGAEKECRR